jgi:hypothetical protein
MRSTSTQLATAICLMAITCISTGAMAAPINVADNGTIVACNSDLGVDINDPAYTVFNVIDGQNAAPGNDSGSIPEVFHDGSYYLGNQNPGYFILDIGPQIYGIEGIDLFNTNNGTVNDRRTGAYTITASNSISSGSFTTITLAGPITTLATGTLLPDDSPQDPQSVTLLTSGSVFRYLRFDLSAGPRDGAPGPFGFGLNEVRVFLPEPSTGLLLLGACGALARGRRSASR